VPEGTARLVLLVDDPDAPMEGSFVHRVRCNLDPARQGIAEGEDPGEASPGANGLLVARMRTQRHRPASMTTALADPGTCSQLSGTISSSQSASACTTPAVGFAASRSGTPRASATDAEPARDRSGRPSSTSRAPSPNRSAASVAARSASRVLPHLPGRSTSPRGPCAGHPGPRQSAARGPPASSPRRAARRAARACRGPAEASLEFGGSGSRRRHSPSIDVTRRPHRRLTGGRRVVRTTR
jgi:hypothetical protein